jgi:hypothetical protein
LLKIPPEQAIPWSDPRLRPAYLASVIAGLLGILLLSRVMINQDEYIYAGEARMLLHGRLVPIEGDPLPAAHLTSPNFEGPRYPPGWPLALTLGALWDFRGMFAVAIFVHLLGGIAMARMLVRRELPSVLCSVWLFHPLFWSFSRTLMSDVPAAALLMMAMDAWENGRRKTASGFLGYGLLVRTASLVSAVGFGLAVGKEPLKRWRLFLPIATGMASGVFLLCLTNWLKYGHPFRSPYNSAAGSLFTARGLAANAWIYGLALLAIPPFPLLCLLLRPGSCDRWAWVAVPVVGFFLFYGYRDQSPRFLENLLGGQRLILAAHAALIISTAQVWSRIPLIRVAPVILGAGVVAALGHHVAVRHLDQRYGNAAQAVAACQPQEVLYNQFASRVALSTDAKSFHLLRDQPPATTADVAVISLRQPTNKYDAANTFEVPVWLRSRVDHCQRYGDFYVFDLAGRCPRGGEVCTF